MEMVDIVEQEDFLQLNDLALADSFINFDYVPDIPDPTAVGSGSSHSDPPINSATLEQAIEKISLVESGIEGKGNGDVVVRAAVSEIINIANDHESQSSQPETATTATTSSSSSTSSSTTATSSDSDEKSELEEGEIVESDPSVVVVDDDGEDGADDITSWDIVDDDPSAGRPVRSQNELEILPLVPPVNVTLGQHHQMLPVGVVTSILGARVVVEGVEKHEPLNEGSILWMTESRTPLGLIDEIFGPVKNPYYIVRYNSENEVPEGIRGGTLISFVPEFADHVLNNKDLYEKGYDASGPNDEEVSDEAEFSDDEKEAEYNRMQKMTKRGMNNQNREKRKNNREKVPPRDGFVPRFPRAPATPSLDHGHCSPISGIGQGPLGATTIRNPPFSPTNAGPSLATSGFWTNGTTLPQQQSAVLPNGFPTNDVSWYPGNTQISHQLPVPGVPSQQQLNPNHGFPPAPIYPGVQPNIFAQPMYAQGPMNQNQITFGLSSPFPQIQPPINFYSSSISGNQHAPHQYNPGASAYRGRRTFHRGSSRGWRPAR